MRSTLTLDDEVAALVKQAMKKSKLSLKKVINDALKRGLLAQSEASPKARTYSTPVHSGGRILIGDTVNIGELLSRFDEEQR